MQRKNSSYWYDAAGEELGYHPDDEVIEPPKVSKKKPIDDEKSKEKLIDDEKSQEAPAEVEEEAVPELLRIKTSMMTSKDVSELDDKATFKIGFARKDIVGAVGLQHSAVAFYDVTSASEEKWLILGRQTPGFLKEGVKDAKQVRGGLFHNYISSAVDNEKHYNFFRENKFVPEMSNAILTGKEVKEITQATDASICKDRMFNLVVSNCYSASVSMLANAIKVIAKRPEKNPGDKDKNNESIRQIYQLIKSAQKDNLGLNLGVATEPTVKGLLQEVEEIVGKRKLLTPLPSPRTPNFLRSNRPSLALDSLLSVPESSKKDHYRSKSR